MKKASKKEKWLFSESNLRREDSEREFLEFWPTPIIQAGIDRFCNKNVLISKELIELSKQYLESSHSLPCQQIVHLNDWTLK